MKLSCHTQGTYTSVLPGRGRVWANDVTSSTKDVAKDLFPLRTITTSQTKHQISISTQRVGDLQAPYIFAEPHRIGKAFLPTPPSVSDSPTKAGQIRAHPTITSLTSAISNSLQSREISLPLFALPATSTRPLRLKSERLA